MTQTKKPKPGAKDAKSNSTLWWILGGMVGLGLIVALAISIAGEEPVDDTIGFGDPTSPETRCPSTQRVKKMSRSA